MKNPKFGRDFVKFIAGNSSDYYLVHIDMSNLLFKAICLKIQITRDDLQDTYRMLS